MSRNSIKAGADAAVKRGLIEQINNENDSTQWRLIVQGGSKIDPPPGQNLTHPGSNFDPLSRLNKDINKHKKNISPKLSVVDAPPNNSKSTIFSFDGENDLPIIISGKQCKSSKNNASAVKQRGGAERTKKKDERLSDPKVGAVRAILHITPNDIQRGEIIDKVTDQGLGGKTLQWWALKGYNPRNIGGALEVYLKGGPTYAKSNGNGYHQEEHEPIAAEVY